MSSWYDYIPSLPFQLGNYAVTGGGPVNDAVQWGQQKSNVPQIGPNPYQGDWTSLITQLQNTARGTGPSLAGNAYKQASADQMNAAQSMAAGGSAGGARQAQMMMGKTNQGIAQGYANARLQEQLAAQQMLGGALTGAGNAWFQPQKANLNANMMTPDNMTKLMSFLQTVGPMASAAGL